MVLFQSFENRPSAIEQFVPQQTDLFDIKDLLNVMEPYIKRLEITELLPPTLLIVSN